MTTSALRALGLALICFCCFNANLREIGGVDTQPAKFLPREIVLRGTLALDEVIRRTPAYARRVAFSRARDGHYRSAYSAAGSLAALPMAAAAAALPRIDLEGPLTPALMAKVTASLLCSVAVGLLFLAARRRCGDRPATLVAIGFGLGTNVWATASQSLWQHESVLAAFALAIWALARPHEVLHDRHLWIASVALGWAGFARPQVAPAILLIAAGLVSRRRRWRDLIVLTPPAAIGSVAVAINVAWFGHVLGAMPLIEAQHEIFHATRGSFAESPLWHALGLLVSPSRGLIVFSPIVLVSLLGLRSAIREGTRGDLVWWLLAAFTQFAAYSCFSIWWAGHTYGPRYLLDILPLLVPPASAGMGWLLATRVPRLVAGAALAWSITLAATGAWCYPADAWNTDPTEVDRDHVRFWDWRDPQFVRCWQRGLSPQNFAFLDPNAFTERRVR